jgi:uncharacterized delta-60 repeat protein
MKHILLFLLSLVAVSYVLPQAGTLDASFARNGVAYTDFGTTSNVNSDICQQMLLKNDGSFFLVFEMNEQSMVTHRLADGALDKTYGNNGYSQSVPLRHPSAVLQPDGKIVVGGYTMINNSNDFVLARFNTDGSLDNSFSGDGLVTVDFSSTGDYLNDIALQPDGKIIAVGRSDSQSGNLSSIARFNRDGTLDNSFLNVGKSLRSVPSVFDAVTVQADGKIVVAGDAYGQIMVTRLMPNGSLDNTFSADGITTVSSGVYSSPRTLAIDPGGKILVGGLVAQAGFTNFLITRLRADGETDMSFSGDGRQDTDFGADESVQALALQPDSKILAVGSSDSGSEVDFAIARYNPDGSLDYSFSSDGIDVAAVGNEADFAFDVAIQPGNEILIAGWSMVGNGVDYSVMRFLPDGSVDLSFAKRGKLLDCKPSGYSQFKATAVQKDGKIIAVGFANTGHDMQFAVARYNVDGSLDRGFADNGMRTINFGLATSLAYDVAIQPDGGIVVAGCAGGGNNYHIALARLNYDGSPDNSFNGNGRLLLDQNSIGLSIGQYARMTLQSDDKIVIAANIESPPSTGDIALVRCSSTGVLDPSFGNGGKVITNLGSSSDRVWDVLFQPDGKLVALGAFDYYDQSRAAVLRYNTNGTLDPSFGNEGLVITGVSGRRDAVFAGALQKDGKILAAGNITTNAGNDLLVLRYNSNGSLDTSFSHTGKLVFDMSSTSEVLQALALQKDGKIIAAGYMHDGSGNTPALARFNPDGTFDTGFSSDGKIVGEPDRAMLFDLAISENRLYAVGSGMDGGAYVGVTAAYLLGPSCPGTLAVVIPDATSLDNGAAVNTVYKGYVPASQITLTAKPGGGSTPYKYSWNNGAGTPTISVSPSTGTNYSVTVTDASGCVVTASKHVNVIDVSCGNNNDKVIVCQSAPGNGKSKSVCIASSAVAAQLRNGSRLGECMQAAITTRLTEEATEELKLLAWPNPSSSTFTLRLNNAVPGTYSMIVRDALGRVVEQKKLDGERPEEIGVNYKRGIYSVSVVAGEKMLNVLVLKQ